MNVLLLGIDIPHKIDWSFMESVKVKTFKKSIEVKMFKKSKRLDYAVRTSFAKLVVD
jgi:hypothetical protein